MWTSDEVEEVVLTKGPSLLVLQSLQECKVVKNLKWVLDNDGFMSHLCRLVTNLKWLHNCLSSLSLGFIVSISGHNPYVPPLHNPHIRVVLKLKALVVTSLAQRLLIAGAQ